MAHRRYVSATGKRWMLAFIVVLSVTFASVAYVQFDASRFRATKDAAVDHHRIQNAAVLRDEIEEIRQEKAAEKEEINRKLSSSPVGKGIVASRTNPKAARKKSASTCPAPMGNPNKATFDVSNMTYSLTMNDLNWNGDVGVWDQEMEAKFRAMETVQNAKPVKRKLKVFVVPFSHSDPGWLMTVDGYFAQYTKNTLDLMLQRLQRWPDMTFIWAEVSFFEMWWATLDDVRKSQVRQLVSSGRLEIVNGGYVMPDEASTHYYAVLHQYVYGHQWLLQHLHQTPRHGFSIDPFGYSSSMPYLLKNLGFESIFIQRIHYVIRKRLVHAKASQFLWQQPWDAKNTEAMFTYMSHATLYDIKHTCGQDNSVCIQFDYQYPGIEQNNQTLLAPANALLEQFRKTSMFYPHDAILFPIGMDFRWSTEAEWDAKHTNFRIMMDILNANPANDVEMKFGTYNDYYREVFRQMGRPDQWKDLPSVQGDFFPYADRTVEYWTGYFTSHPFQKALSRDLENHLRTAEILYVLGKMRGVAMDSVGMLASMELAAKNLGLYQHHDAITGTSKQAVSDDYEQRLFKSVSDMYDVIQYIASSMIWPMDSARDGLTLHTTRPVNTAPPIKNLLLVKTGPKRLVIFNSLASVRHFAVDILIDSQNVIITDSAGKFVPYQISTAMDPFQYQADTIATGVRLTFLVEFKSIGMQSFTVKSVEEKEAVSKGQSMSESFDETSKGFSYDKPFLLENGFMKALFSPSSGLLEAITDTSGVTHQVRLEFKRYETSRSGAYLFWPFGVADMAPHQHGVRLVDGAIYTEIQVVLPRIMRHVVRLFKSPSDLGQSLHVENTHNLMMEQNIEPVMRLSTDIKNNLEFHTDSNGFQMVPRRTGLDLPMQANYFPATTMAFLQDKHARITLHLGEAHGVGSQDLGQIEVMLDRFLSQDDARGVEEALRDSRVVHTNFRIQLETEEFCRDCLQPQPTSLASRINLDLNNPAVTLSAAMKPGESVEDAGLSTLTAPLMCGLHLVMLKPVTYTVEPATDTVEPVTYTVEPATDTVEPATDTVEPVTYTVEPATDTVKSTRVGVILHRIGTDCAGDGDGKCGGKSGTSLDLSKFFKFKRFDVYNETTLNFVDTLKTAKRSVAVTVDAMKMVAVTLNV